jgi:hypothetical protein
MNGSYFGLTQLGVQNPFQAQLRNNVDLNWFEDDEFAAAWELVGAGASVDLGGLQSVLEQVFRGPAPDGEGPRFAALLGESADGRLTKEALLAALPGLKEEAAYEQVEGKGREFTSAQELVGAHKKHARMGKHPHDKFAAPLTAAQMVGWDALAGGNETGVEGGLNAIRRPKMSCPETQYADIMVKSGVYF